MSVRFSVLMHSNSSYASVSLLHSRSSNDACNEFGVGENDLSIHVLQFTVKDVGCKIFVN